MPVCADLWAQSQCNSGVTLHSRPKDADLAVIKFHASIGVRKGDPNNRCTKARGGGVVVLQTATVSDSSASSRSLGVPGPVAARAELRSATVGAVTLCTVSNSVLTSTVAGSIPRQPFWVNYITVPSPGVACTK